MQGRARAISEQLWAELTCRGVAWRFDDDFGAAYQLHAAFEKWPEWRVAVEHLAEKLRLQAQGQAITFKRLRIPDNMYGSAEGAQVDGVWTRYIHTLMADPGAERRSRPIHRIDVAVEF